MEMKNDLHTKILLLSDNHITRSGLRRILEEESTIDVVGEDSIANMLSVESLIRQEPDIILLDLETKGLDALGFIRNLRNLTRSSGVIILCDLGDNDLARKALMLGVAGIVLKTQPPSVLLATIRSLTKIKPHHPEIAVPIRESAHPHVVDKPSSRMVERIECLTAREREIIRLIAVGLRNKEVARRLHISDITVRHHLTSIFNKLNVNDRQKLLILAHEHGLAELAFNPNA